MPVASGRVIVAIGFEWVKSGKGCGSFGQRIP